ncbi:MAG: anti-sigma factor [Saprospiraceae bacterium]|nr:anti-sigma factor [Saprospiraceae bacterium]
MLSSDIKGFLESSLLEEYLLGLTNAEQSRHVEQMIHDHAEVRAAYDKLQDSIAHLAEGLAMPAPEGLRQRVLNEIIAEEPAAQITPVRRRTNWMAIAASIVALVMAGVALMQSNRAGELQREVASLVAQIEDLQTDAQGQAVQFASLQDQIDVINNPETERFVLRGNQQAPGFEAVAYWNAHQRQSYLHVRNLPDLPDRQCYQMWADVDGEMISVGVIPDTDEPLVGITFLENAESLNVTIEPEGGSDHPNVQRLVANVVI